MRDASTAALLLHTTTLQPAAAYELQSRKHTLQPPAAHTFQSNNAPAAYRLLGLKRLNPSTAVVPSSPGICECQCRLAGSEDINTIRCAPPHCCQRQLTKHVCTNLLTESQATPIVTQAAYRLLGLKRLNPSTAVVPNSPGICECQCSSFMSVWPACTNSSWLGKSSCSSQKAGR